MPYAWCAHTIIPSPPYFLNADGNVVLWFGNDEYEGLGDNCRWKGEASNSDTFEIDFLFRDSMQGLTLVDSDGDTIQTRINPSNSDLVVQALLTADDDTAKSCKMRRACLRT